MSAPSDPVPSTWLRHAARLALAAGALGLWAAATTPPMAAEQTVVSPPQYANSDSIFRSSSVPFNNLSSHIRYQQVFDAGAFQAVADDIIQIHGISLRADEARLPGVPWFAAVVPKIEIRLATSPLNASRMSATFADNVGPDLAVVYPEGPLSLWVSRDNAAAPQPFLTTIRFDQPFWYDPGAGHLLLDILKPEGGAPFDFGFDAGGGAYAIGGYDAPSADLVNRGNGLIVQFIFTPIPEPGVAALLLLGCLALRLGKARQ